MLLRVQTSVLYSTGNGHVLQDTVPHFLLRLQNRGETKYFHENDSLSIQQLKLLLFFLCSWCFETCIYACTICGFVQKLNLNAMYTHNLVYIAALMECK